MDRESTTIGHTEKIDLPEYGLFGVPAKVDTGADVSAIWASDIRTEHGRLAFTLFGTGSPYYSGNVIAIPEGSFVDTTVANSFGQKEQRYKVKLLVSLRGRAIRATFTLADRSQKRYPILLGRRLLRGKFVVDVKKGQPLPRQETAEALDRERLDD